MSMAVRYRDYFWYFDKCPAALNLYYGFFGEINVLGVSTHSYTFSSLLANLFCCFKCLASLLGFLFFLPKWYTYLNVNSAICQSYPIIFVKPESFLRGKNSFCCKLPKCYYYNYNVMHMIIFDLTPTST